MKAILTLLAVPLLVSTAAAQDPFAPAKEMQKFAPMLGHWEGSGSAMPGPDMESMTWTATSHVERIVGGHAIRETTRVEFPVPDFPALEFVTVHAWNRETQRYMSMGVQNMGAGHSNEVFWTDANTFVSSRTGFEEGQPLVERAVSRFAGGKYTFKIDRANGAGPVHTYVEGKFARSKPAEGAKTIKASMHAGTTYPNDGMSKASKMLGKWKVAGKMKGSPGADAPEMSFSGTETIESVLGGFALQARIIGDADESGPEYDGLWYLSWNDRDAAYDMFFVSNMGEVGISQGWMIGKDFVSTAALTQMGTPVANRMVVHMGEDGIESAIAHASSGTGEPMKVFEARYTRVK